MACRLFLNIYISSADFASILLLQSSARIESELLERGARWSVMPWLVGCAADFCGINQLHLPEFLFSNFSFLYKIENFISVRPLTSTRTLRLPTHVCPTFGMQGWHRGRVLEGCRLVAEGSRRVLRQIEDNRHHTFLTTNGPRSTS